MVDPETIGHLSLDDNGVIGEASGAVEEIIGLTFHPKGLEFQVMSSGCTEKNQADWPEETASPDEFVQLAIVYRGRAVVDERICARRASAFSRNWSASLAAATFVNILRYSVQNRREAGTVASVHPEGGGHGNYC